MNTPVPKTETEFLWQRYGFLQGVIEANRLNAVWKDGVQMVGCLPKPLQEMNKPYEEELEKIGIKIRAT